MGLGSVWPLDLVWYLGFKKMSSSCWYFHCLNFPGWLKYLWSSGPLRSRAAKAIGFIDMMIDYSIVNAPLQKELSAGDFPEFSLSFNFTCFIPISTILSHFTEFISWLNRWSGEHSCLSSFAFGFCHHRCCYICWQWPERNGCRSWQSNL